MDRAIAVVLIVLVATALLLAMALGWRARRRRQADLPPLATPPASPGQVRLAQDVLYVATTQQDAPLDRIAVGGLGFRAAGRVIVRGDGVLLELAGNVPAFIPAGDLRGAGRANWTIDRAVGRDRLVLLRWTLGPHALDSYLRSPDPDALVAALTDLLPVATEEAPA